MMNGPQSVTLELLSLRTINSGPQSVALVLRSLRLTSVIGSQAEVGLLTYEFRKTLSLHKCVILLHKIDLINQLLFMNARYGCVD